MSTEHVFGQLADQLDAQLKRAERALGERFAGASASVSLGDAGTLTELRWHRDALQVVDATGGSQRLLSKSVDMRILAAERLPALIVALERIGTRLAACSTSAATAALTRYLDELERGEKR